MGKIRRILATDSYSNVLSSVLSILIGLLVGFIILLISNPSQAFNGFISILVGGFSNMKDLGQVLYFATPIIMTGLSVGFASRTGLFNIGASGQFIAGAYVAILIGIKCTFLPGPLRWITALLGAMLAGAIWGAIPGILKAYRNVNEVIACIMMNYIGMYVVNYLILNTGVYESMKNQTKRVPDVANVPRMGLDKIFKTSSATSSVNSGVVIAVLMAIVIFIILQKTTFGYELKACGFNRESARYAGINENRSIIFSMMIAGALAGLGGALLYLAGSGKGIDVVDVLAAEGFNGIPVALLGLNNPIGIIFSGLLVAHLNVGGTNMQLYGFAPQVIEIIISIIIYFSALALLFKGLINIIIKDRKKVPVSSDQSSQAPWPVKPENDENLEPDETKSGEKGG